MNKIFQIAIDGPTASGKSTISSIIAEELKIAYIDTGAMYRALALKAYRKGFDSSFEDGINGLLDDISIDFREDGVYLDGENVSDQIRENHISLYASTISAYPKVREVLTKMQKEIASNKSVIMDGRDIGTNVLKDAEYKFFLIASPEVRAIRRYKELESRGDKIELDKLIEEINQRDFNDTNRKINPMKKAKDAMEIDTSEMTVEEVKNFIISRINE
ncbi:MAG: (d)CMP kinase [Tissierellia bacterium]|nr:(d)CMP kinase [Tissierellia bacterium]